ncbi:MAG: Purine nucleoside phosphorylase, partial [uncultured Rubrobacteraceae bacterium]
EPCSRAGRAGRFRRKRVDAGGPEAGDVHRGELLRGREARYPGEGDARVHGYVQGQPRLGPDHGDGVSLGGDRHGGAHAARGEEPAPGRDLRRVPPGDDARGPRDSDRRHRPGRHGLQHHRGRAVRPRRPLRPRTRGLPRCREDLAGAPPLPRPDREHGPLLRPRGGPAGAVELPRRARGGDGGRGDLHPRGDAGREGRVPAHGLGHHRGRGRRADRRLLPQGRRGQHDGAGARDPGRLKL